MSNLSAYERIRSIAFDEIKLDMEVDGRKNVAEGEIESHIANLIKSKPQFQKIVSAESLINDLKMKFSIKVIHQPVIITGKDKSDWYNLDRIKRDRKIGFWERYENFIRKKIPGQYRSQLDECTNEVMSNIEDPNKMGEWDKRGLVMGSVQSGKTSQIVGVVNKALDSGYNFIIILTGITNDLRSQTQDRIDEGVLGKETEHDFGDAEMSKGVGHEGTVKFQPESFTNSSANGDYSKKVAKHTHLDPEGKSPRILVIKKTLTVLETLIEKFNTLKMEKGVQGIEHFPIMVIDDECDQASVDTKKGEEELSKINEKIRELLNLFKRKAYIGYTATPYANAAINHLAFHKRVGKDLFPKDFIFQLPINSDYVGLNRLFPDISFDEDGNEIAENYSSNQPLEVINDFIDKYNVYKNFLYKKKEDIYGWMPPAHNKDHTPQCDGISEIPKSLRRAIIYFTLACCVKRLRNKESLKHNSMMIHATRFNDVQTKITEQVDDFLVSLQSTQYEWLNEVEDEIFKIWNKNFKEKLNNDYNPGRKEIEWEEIKEIYGEQVNKIRVQEINNKTKTYLDYREFKENGKHVIAIGGNRLSRGLTLEGLNVSYYLRSARTSAVATATQMGRWFGYRNSYDDVCRIYMPESTIYLFQKLHETERHFRAEIRRMNALNERPLDFGLRFLSYEGVNLDSVSKMRHCMKYSKNIDHEGKVKQPISILPHKNKHNIVHTEKFLNNLGHPSFIGPGLSNDKTIKFNEKFIKKEPISSGSYIWLNIDGKKISNFIKTENFIVPSSEKSIIDDGLINNDGDFVSQYIDLMMKYNELNNWTVVLRNNSKSKTNIKSNLAGYPLYLVKRRPRNGYPNNPRVLDDWSGKVQEFDEKEEDKYITGITNDPSLESYDLNEAEFKKYESLLKKFKKDDKDIDYLKSQCVRKARSAKKGLLVIYPIYPTDKVDSGYVEDPYLLWTISFPFRDDRTVKGLNQEITLNTVDQKRLEEEANKKLQKEIADMDKKKEDNENEAFGYLEEEDITSNFESYE